MSIRRRLTVQVVRPRWQLARARTPSRPAGGVTDSAIGAAELVKQAWPLGRYLGAVSGDRVPGGVVHKLPADVREALIANPAALDAWKDITPLARNESICWVEDAKQEMTRERRIRRTRRSWRKASVGPAAGPGAGTASTPADSDQRLRRIPNVPSCTSDERHGRSGNKREIGDQWAAGAHDSGLPTGTACGGGSCYWLGPVVSQVSVPAAVWGS
jgi:bacteriocin resistance YdeI/OmpD-like protein